jgi:hypothetical protein
MKIKEKQKVIILRKEGYSLKEIKDIVPVSKSTISLWIKDVPMNGAAQKRLASRYTYGQIRSQEVIKEKTIEKNRVIGEKVKNTLNGISFNKKQQKVLCAMIYWCEGNKGIRDLVFFTNSDPSLIKTFLHLFRSSFDVSEDKFRVCMHLHSYHNESEQKDFWSKVTNISKKQFFKTYHKTNSGLYKKEGYQGCVQIRYMNVSIARELLALAKAYMNKGL